MSLTPARLKELPEKPGCYLFYDGAGRLLYIGKAKDIRKRVASYFRKKDLDPKTAVLVRKIDRMETFITHNEVEAYILENSLIKKHQPPYNIDLKDAKQYAYLQVTCEEYPRLILARRRDSMGKFFGPFVSGQERDHVQQQLVRIFRLRTCKKLPKKTCLRFHLGLCTAPCAGLVDPEEYRNQVEGAVSVLKGRTDELLDELRLTMKTASIQENYEYALALRNQIAAIEKLKEKQAIDLKRTWDEDVIDFARKGDEMVVMLFHVEFGLLTQKQEFLLPAGDQVFEEFLARYYDENPPPREVILPRTPGAALQEYLSRERKVIFTVPRQGEKKRLLDLVARNIENSYFAGDIMLAELQKRLNLERPPEVIECFDVSHLSGSSAVASMVQFRLGRPDKHHYRRFRIRSASGIDDFAATAEVVRRRYTRLLSEKSELPDLIVIDGGAGQLSAALDELSKLELSIPAIAIAKRFEEIYLPGYESPLALPEKDPALILVRQVRDEAHRFAVSFHRLLRSKRTLPVKSTPG